MLQTGSSLGSGSASVAQDAADETVAHAEDAAQQVCLKTLFYQQPFALLHCTSRLHGTAHSNIRFHSSPSPFPPPTPLLAAHACTSETLQQQQEPAAAMFCVPYLSAHTHTHTHPHIHTHTLSLSLA